MKCPVCNNEINGFVCSECGFDESMNYEKFPTVAVFNNSIESISVKIDNYRSPWEDDRISEYCRLELLLKNAFDGAGKAQKALAEYCYSINETERFEYWKAQAEGKGFNVDCSKISVISNNVFDFPKVNKMKTKEKVCAGYYNTVRVRSDGTCASTKISDDFVSYGQDQVSGWTDIVDVAVGKRHTVGLKADGTVVATGYTGNYYSGECDVSDWTDIVAVSAGYDHTVGLKSDGTVVAVGNNYSGPCDVSDWTDIIAVSAGFCHTVGLKSDGTVVAVGFNGCGQCYVSDWADIIAVSAVWDHTVGLKSDGTVVAVGDNDDFGDVKSWKKIISISVGTNHVVGLKEDGTVVAVGDNYYGQCNVSDWTDIVSISAGEYHTVGLKSNGEVVAVGNNFCCQCNVKELMR